VSGSQPKSEVSVSSSRFRPFAIALVGLVVAALVSACVATSSTPPSNPPISSLGPGGSAEPSVAPTKLVVGLGYIPSVQFAQFYLAKQNGYYADGGLSVEFQNQIDPNLITLVGAGKIDIGIGDGTSVIPAASNAIPIQYVATVYGKFPNIVFAKASSGITVAADLKGKKIGVPGRYGSGWIMLQALLASANLTTDDVQIVEYPDFTQEVAVEQGAVDAATGFTNNEPVLLELHGTKASVLTIDAITPLPGPGLIASKATLDAKPSHRSSRPRSRRWSRSRRTRPSGSMPRSRRSPNWPRPVTPRRPSWRRRSRPGRAPSRTPTASAPSTVTDGRSRSRSLAHSASSRTRSPPTPSSATTFYRRTTSGGSCETPESGRI